MIENTQCPACKHVYEWRFGPVCPLCRVPDVPHPKSIDKTPVTKRLPVPSVVGHKVTVAIREMNGEKIHSFKGVVLGETSTHFQVGWPANPRFGELFAKQSERVNCYLVS